MTKLLTVIKPIPLLITLVILSCTANAQKSNYKKPWQKCSKQNQIVMEDNGCMTNVTAPDFSGLTISGKKFQLNKLRGQVVVLNFWFIACAPCRAEVPGLNVVAENFKNKKVAFVSVAFDSEPELKKYLAKTVFSFQTIADPNYLICKKIYQITGYPCTIIIDKKGKIRFYSVGGKISEASNASANIFYRQPGKTNDETVIKEIKDRLTPTINACLNAK